MNSVRVSICHDHCPVRSYSHISGICKFPVGLSMSSPLALEASPRFEFLHTVVVEVYNVEVVHPICCHTGRSVEFSRTVA